MLTQRRLASVGIGNQTKTYVHNLVEYFVAQAFSSGRNYLSIYE